MGPLRHDEDSLLWLGPRSRHCDARKARQARIISIMFVVGILFEVVVGLLLLWVGVAVGAHLTASLDNALVNTLGNLLVGFVMTLLTVAISVGIGLTWSRAPWTH